MRKLPKPTDAELTILRVLWTRGPSTVRQVHDALNEERPTGYTTALKLLQIMADKGLVARDESDRTHVYTASVSEGETQRQLLDDLMARAFRGSAMTLVMQALSGAKATPDELARIRQLLDEHEGGAR
jgi:predicted transcriptional regulator